MQNVTNQTINFAAPAIGSDGRWATVGGLAVRHSLENDASKNVLEVMHAMSPSDALLAAKENGLKGQDLQSISVELASRSQSIGVMPQRAQERSPVTKSSQILDAASLMQAIMKSPSVTVYVLGNAPATERASLLMIAGQAIEKDIQGFGFDGIPGKFNVPLSMAQMIVLHRNASIAVAKESAQAGLSSWADGKKADVHSWVPDSVQRMLTGSLSVDSARAIVHAIDGGIVAKHAQEIGEGRFARVMKVQGYDVDAPTVDMQAKELGFTLVEPNRKQSTSVGPVMGMDHRAALIKVNRTSVIEVPFNLLNEKPSLGAMVRVGFKDGVPTVNVAQNKSQGVSR